MYGWQGDSPRPRDAHEVLLVVFDGLLGLEEAFKAVYPKADVQRCVGPQNKKCVKQGKKKTNLK